MRPIEGGCIYEWDPPVIENTRAGYRATSTPCAVGYVVIWLTASGHRRYVRTPAAYRPGVTMPPRDAEDFRRRIERDMEKYPPVPDPERGRPDE